MPCGIEPAGSFGVHCPHGMELPGDDPVLGHLVGETVSVVGYTGIGTAGAIGLKVKLGLGTNPEVEGN